MPRPSRSSRDPLPHLNAEIERATRRSSLELSASTPVDQVFEKRQGVCQDFAHLEIAMLRALGLPVCYVSGYVNTSPEPGQPKLQSADASHAWISVWCPGFGYVDFDPTNASMPRDEHITWLAGAILATQARCEG